MGLQQAMESAERGGGGGSKRKKHCGGAAGGPNGSTTTISAMHLRYATWGEMLPTENSLTVRASAPEMKGNCKHKLHRRRVRKHAHKMDSQDNILHF